MNRSGAIDNFDIQYVAGNWPTAQVDPGWGAVVQYDFNHSGAIDNFDIQFVAGNWPTACSAP